MNSKKFGSKVKGFTLIELIIVIAIIGILAGMISLFVAGFQRDARIETNNNKARMIYTAFQNILINCEIDQDDEVFDIYRYYSPSSDKDAYKLKYVTVEFGMNNAKLDDKITIHPTYNDPAVTLTATDNEGPLRNDSRPLMKEYFGIMEEAILANLDNSFEGYGIVYIDFEDYAVDSVIYFEKGIIPSSVTNYARDVGSVTSELDGYADKYYFETNKNFTMLNSINDQKKFYKYVGSHLGAYPKVDDFDPKPTKTS